MGPDSKLHKKLVKATTKIVWNRIENLSNLGTPDLLGYNNSGTFFTVELKVTRGNKVKLSPHQLAFHVKHPNNTFVLVKALSLNSVKLYEGKVIKELDDCGLKLEACESGLEACCLLLEAWTRRTLSEPPADLLPDLLIAWSGCWPPTTGWRDSASLLRERNSL